MDEARAVRTTCPYCGVGCGVLAEVAADGKASVRGDPEHPANFGKLCSKGSALAETMGIEGRLAPSRDRRQAGWLGCGARSGGEALFRDHCRARARCGRLLRLGPAPDRRLLRRQQADERVSRLGQHRHQFAPLHGVLGRRPPPRLRRGYRARQSTRISRRPTSSSWSARIPPGATRCSTSGFSRRAHDVARGSSSSIRAAPRPSPNPTCIWR